MTEQREQNNFQELLRQYDGALDQAYSDALNNPRENDKIFSLNNIPEGAREAREAELKQKLDELTNDLESRWRGTRFLPFDGSTPAGKFQRDPLRILLSREDREVNMTALLEAYKEMDGGVVQTARFNAEAIPAVREYTEPRTN